MRANYCIVFIYFINFLFSNKNITDVHLNIFEIDFEKFRFDSLRQHSGREIDLYAFLSVQENPA